jgi:predicted negative regulator of RcsB-dependent stress response
MAFSFMQMPGIRTPDTSIDFNPLSKALAGYNAGHEQATDRNQLLELGRTAIQGGPRAAANAAFGQGRIETGTAFQDRAQGDEDRITKRYGALARQIDMVQDPAQRSRMWTGFLGRMKREAASMGVDGEFDPDEMDPVTGPKLFMGKAGLVSDPLEREHKQAQIDSLRRSNATGGEQPSSVKEWEYFNRLTPDQKRQFLIMKRAEKYYNAGTEFVAPDPIDPAADPKKIDINVAEKARQTELGQSRGKAEAALPTVLNAADRMLATIDAIDQDPNLDKVTGFVGGRIPKHMQTEAMAETQSRLEQVQGQTFLQAYNDLRGAGQITEREGAAAQAAYNRLTTQTMGTPAYRKALKEFRSEVTQLVEIAKQKTGASDGGNTLQGRGSGSFVQPGKIDLGGNFSLEFE